MLYCYIKGFNECSERKSLFWKYLTNADYDSLIEFLQNFDEQFKIILKVEISFLISFIYPKFWKPTCFQCIQSKSNDGNYCEAPERHESIFVSKEKNCIDIYDEVSYRSIKYFKFFLGNLSSQLLLGSQGFTIYVEDVMGSTYVYVSTKKMFPDGLNYDFKDESDGQKKIFFYENGYYGLFPYYFERDRENLTLYVSVQGNKKINQFNFHVLPYDEFSFRDLMS